MTIFNINEVVRWSRNSKHNPKLVLKLLWAIFLAARSSRKYEDVGAGGGRMPTFKKKVLVMLAQVLAYWSLGQSELFYKYRFPGQNPTQ